MILGKCLVSIICTVKNGERTLQKTLDSVMNQTYEEWELIIIDDGSNDSTHQILEENSKRDLRIKPILTGGIGRGKALNKAIINSEGDYIANIDADDLMHPERIAKQVKYFSGNKDTFLISSEYIIIYEDESLDWKNVNNDDSKIIPIKSDILIKNSISHSSVMINRKGLIHLNMYNQHRKSQFDYDLWLRAYIKNEKMVKSTSKLIAKRIHQNQSFENKKRLVYLFRSCTLQINYILKYKRKLHYLIIPPTRMLFGLLPFKLRQKIQGK